MSTGNISLILTAWTTNPDSSQDISEREKRGVMKESPLFHPYNPIPSLLPLNVLLCYVIIKQVLTNYNLDQDTQTDHETINGLPLLLADTVLIPKESLVQTDATLLANNSRHCLMLQVASRPFAHPLSCCWKLLKFETNNNSQHVFCSVIAKA